MMPRDQKMILILSTVDQDYSKYFPMVRCYKEVAKVLKPRQLIWHQFKKKKKTAASEIFLRMLFSYS